MLTLVHGFLVFGVIDPKLTLIDARLVEVRITLLQGHSNDCERAEPCHLKASSEHQWRLRSLMLPCPPNVGRIKHSCCAITLNK
jgi:hypothetical protein